MTKPFSAPQTKIDRARRHLQELRSEIDDYFRRGGAQVIFETAQEFASAGEMGAFTYREKESIPIAWSAIIGDVLHNLRSSLDLLACDLHRMTGGNPEHISGVHYPFCKSKADLT
ncbi:hypothetical protein MXD81_64450, partial [Microbacteriaceae bacterium K1510]|nr:hypothetical protein [Microbacteriaceae bacterium K1510]